MALNWYVARTKPLAEYNAKEQLKAAGVEVFLPCVVTARPRPGHNDEPLFPGYLFVRYDLEKWGWPRLVLENKNLLDLVRFGGTAAPVSDTVVTELAHRVEAINKGETRTLIRSGDKVRVRLGDIEERLIGVVTETVPESARVKVLLDFLGMKVPVEVANRDVQPAKVGDSKPVGQDRSPRRTRGRGRWIQGFGPRATSAT